MTQDSEGPAPHVQSEAESAEVGEPERGGGEESAAERPDLDERQESGGGWCWWDIAPTTRDRGSTNLWFDHPDAALTRSNLYVTFNVFDGQTTIDCWDVAVRTWAGAISSTAPNGVNWLGGTDPRITGGSIGKGTIAFMWPAGQCRAHHPDCAGWVASGYALQGGKTRQDILPRVAHYALIP